MSAPRLRERARGRRRYWKRDHRARGQPPRGSATITFVAVRGVRASSGRMFAMNELESYAGLPDLNGLIAGSPAWRSPQRAPAH